jgi:stage II sporulation protein D
MDLDAYLVGVVLAELPASFEPEAKKAQAVAARTYAMRAKMTGGKHDDGSVCVSSGCCQAYTTVEDYYSRGGKTESVAGAEEAVLATSGQVLIYEDKLIQANYFSCSGGRTEDAVAVWGTDVPYLRAQESPGEEEAKHHTDVVAFSPEEFCEALGTSLTGDPEGWFGMTTYTSGDGVATMQICGKTYQGTKLRSLLGLRSTAFTVEVISGEIRITTKGFGHRVGMSQYGADAMAAGGRNYKEILAYYYPGTELILALGIIEHIIRLQDTGSNLDQRVFTDKRVNNRLPDKGTLRAVRIVIRLIRLIVLHILAGDGAVCRAREIPDHIIQKNIDSLKIGGGSDRNRAHVALADILLQRTEDFLLGKLLAAEILVHELFTGLRDSLKHRVAARSDIVLHIGRLFDL